MPLNLSVNDGDITPYLKYNAKAGRWYFKPQGATDEVEVLNPRLAIDMARIKTGWIFYQEGAGPEKVWDPSPDRTAERPMGPKKWKRGFEVMVFGNDQLPVGGKIGLREFSSTATNCITAILSMYAEYEAGMKANPNCVPFYICTGVKPIQGSYGTNYEPLFVLKTWIPLAKIPAFNPKADEDIGWDNSPPVDNTPPPTSPDDYAGASGARMQERPGVDPDMDQEIPF